MWKNLFKQVRVLKASCIVFAECRDIENFDQQKVLEKALLKAFQNEIIKISVVKNSAIKK